MIMMPEDRNLFLKTHLDLLFFVGLKKKVFPSSTSMSMYLKTDTQTKFICRQEMYKDVEIIDEYLASNFDHLDENEISIINGLKKRDEGDFMILKCLQRHAVFISLDTENVYSVGAISDPFTFFFDYFPVIVTTILIPFKNYIIYDGFFQSKNIRFGSGIRHSFNDIYKAAKRNKQIISYLA